MTRRLAFAVLGVFWVLQSGAALPPEVLSVIPKEYDLSLRKYADAKKELEEIVADCGAGVVVDGEPNRCDYNVKLNAHFFLPKKNKTGLLHDFEWAYHDNVTWYLPTTAAVPDNFDLRDLMRNGLPEIKKQKCGDCWAWATHHSVEINRAVHDGLATDHSIQTVLSCSGAGSCGGGYMSAPSFIVGRGLPYEQDFPYLNGTTGSCKFSKADMNAGKWDGKILAAPYVGNSRNYSRALRLPSGAFRDGAKVSEMMAAMVQWNSPLVVTVAAYTLDGPGVYSSCSAVNSGGDHMVTIVGWEMLNGKRVAHVWNSWGQTHGDKGVSRIVWECSGGLNRGLGTAARIVQYRAPCTAPNAAQRGLNQIVLGRGVQIGSSQPAGTRCEWTPTAGLNDPTSCTPNASPTTSTEYHFTATNGCGTSSSMTLVQVWSGERKTTQDILTPTGLLAAQPIYTRESGQVRPR
jgi:hypothetical protein